MLTAVRKQLTGLRPSRDQAVVQSLLVAVYAAGTFLLVSPISTTPGTLAALAGTVAGVAFAWYLFVKRVRLTVAIPAALVLAIGGMILGAWLADSTLLARALGTTLAPGLLDALTFGVTAFSVATVLRLLTLTWRVCALLEVAALAAGVVLAFINHRDMHLGQPRDFADWVLSTGRDPVETLACIGVLTLGLSLIAVQQWSSARRLLKSTAVLLVLLLVGTWAVSMLPADVLQPRPDTPQNGEDANQSDEGQTDDQSNQPRAQDRSDDQNDSDSDGQSGGQPEEGSDSDSDDESDGQSSPLPEPWPQPDAGKKSNRPVALVTVDAEYQPHQPAWYLRQNACSVFNGHRLVRGAASGIDTDVPSEFPATVQRIDNVPQPQGVTRTVPSTVYLLQEQSRPFGLVGPLSFEIIDNPDPNYFRMAYRVESRVLVVPQDAGGQSASPDQSPLVPLLGQPAGSPHWSADTRAVYLEHPDDGRYRQLADDILQQAGVAHLRDRSPLACTLALGQWIAKNTTYSTSVDHSGSDDPAASFLFGSRRGYCVHIAHSMVYLCRSLGIPARAAMGYAVDVAQVSRTNTMTVTGSHAHAWPEIYLQDVGWIVVDTSPENVDPNEPKPQPPDQVTEQFLHKRATQADNPIPYEPESRFPLPLPTWPWLLGGGIAALYVVKVWRRVAPRYAQQDDLHRVCLRSVLDQLSELGLRRRFGETREAFAQRLDQLVPELQPLTAAHVSRAVGDRTGQPEHDWLAQTDAASQRIADASSRQQRIVALLNPVSWILVQ